MVTYQITQIKMHVKRWTRIDRYYLWKKIQHLRIILQRNWRPKVLFPSWKFSLVVILTNSSPTVASKIIVPFKKLWKSKVPKKSKFFLWTAAYKGIFTIETIQGRLKNIYLNPNWWILCETNNETTYYIFLHCPFYEKYME